MYASAFARIFNSISSSDNRERDPKSIQIYSPLVRSLVTEFRRRKKKKKIVNDRTRRSSTTGNRIRRTTIRAKVLEQKNEKNR